MSDTPQDQDDFTLSAEIMDRAERKALKAKAKKEATEKAKKLEPTEEEIELALANTKLAEVERAKKKNMYKLVGTFVGLVLVFLAYDYLFAPRKGGMPYAICKMYLELNVRFPQDLRLSTVKNYGKYVRIWYTQLDAFGEYRMENIECYYRRDKETGLSVEKILIDRREVDTEKVALFNKILPVIKQNPPDLTLPTRLPDSLENLQMNTNEFRFQLNLPQKLAK